MYPDIFLLELENGGPTFCNALVITMNQGKTNQHGNIDYGAFIRHLNEEVYAFGVLSIYFFTWFHLEVEAFPRFTTIQDWYDIYLLKAKDRTAEIGYSTQNKAYKNILEKHSVDTSKTTHINRLSAVSFLDEDAISDNQQRRVGLWGTDRMVEFYLHSLPKQSVRPLAGFCAPHAGNFYLARAAIGPPEELQRMVFPDVEFWINTFDQEQVGKDIAGPNFFESVDLHKNIYRLAGTSSSPTNASFIEGCGNGIYSV